MDKKAFLETAALAAVLFSFVYIQCHSSVATSLAAWIMLGATAYMVKGKKK